MITKKLRSFSAVLALVALSSLFALVAPPAPAAAHGAYQNGCTVVADSGRDFNFHASCDRHDLCYHYKTYGNTKAGRKSCDVSFLNHMKAWCTRNTVNRQVKSGNGRAATWRNPRQVCNNRASLYYAGVRSFGWKFF